MSHAELDFYHFDPARFYGSHTSNWHALTDEQKQDLIDATACLDAAEAAGIHDIAIIESCDLGHLRCPQCPWAEAFEEGLRRARQEASLRQAASHTPKPKG